MTDLHGTEEGRRGRARRKLIRKRGGHSGPEAPSRRYASVKRNKSLWATTRMRHGHPVALAHLNGGAELVQGTAHRKGVFAVGVVLDVHVVDGKLEGIPVQAQGRTA